MQLDSKIVGTPIKGLRKTVDWRETTSYAAGVGDENPRYLDDTIPDGLVAPPLFAVALSWPIVTDLANQLGDAIPPETLTGMVHKSERLVFHRPIRPGDTVTLSGQVSAISPHRAGTYIALQLQASNQQQQPLFTETMGALLRGVSCLGKERFMPNFAPIKTPDFSESPSWENEWQIPRTLPFVYDACSDITFPIHTSKGFAKAVGLPDILLQGTATLALCSKELIDKLGKGQPENLLEISCEFKQMIVPGGSIAFQAIVTHDTQKKKTIAFKVLNSQHQIALLGQAIMM